MEAVEERFGIRGRRVRDVATLRIEDHRDVGWDRLQRQREDVEARGAVALVERHVRLVATRVVTGRVHDPAEEPHGGLWTAPEMFGDAVGFGVEADADHAVPRSRGDRELGQKGHEHWL
jgi:hypothetical protein